MDAPEPVEPSPVEVVVDVEPARSPSSRSRRVTGVVAAMLVAASGGLGFGLGRSVSDDVPAASDAGAAGAATVPAASTLAPTLPVSAPSTTAAVPASDDPVSVATVVGSVDAEIFAGGWPGPGIFPGDPTIEPAMLLLETATPAGDRVRVLRGASWPQPGTGWQPAAFCWGTAELRVTIDGPDVVDIAVGQWFEEIYGDVAVSMAADVGWVDGRPMRVLLVQTAPTVTGVAVTWSDGPSVSAVPADGLAVLITESESASWEQQYTLDVTDASGTRSITAADLDHSADAAWREACNPPPPALPAAGEQPADPEAARAEVEARFDLLWDRSVDAADKPMLLDDDTGVEAARTQVFEGGFAEAAESAQHIVEEFVFVSPTRAWFRYGIDTINGYFGERFGVATLTADGWIFPRAIVCQDLSLAGGQCDPSFESIFPPSWYEMYGEQCVYAPTGDAERCITYEESEIASW